MHKDIERLRNKYNNYYYQEKLINKIEKDIMNLVHMPRIHKTLISAEDKDGEYRRIVLGKYIVIYKIVETEIIILRIFNQKENYLNSKKFILKEETEKYSINRKGKFNMVKLKTLKNSYMKLKENYNRIITGEEVWSRAMDRLIEEAEEELRNGAELTTLEEWREELIREYNVVL